jgi:MtN3 and saliva related transmembrane protein
MSATPVIVVEAGGIGAALCSTASFVPQLVKLLREKSGEAVSLRMYALTVTGFSLWSVYGVMLASWPLVASNLISLGLSFAILLLKWRYQGHAEARNAPGPVRRP